MSNNNPSSPFNSFTLAFRQGGTEGRWGIWFSVGRNDFLVNPDVLVETIAVRGEFPGIFCQEYLDDYLPFPLPFKQLRIAEMPWLVPWYCWELEPKDGGEPLSFSFGRKEYIRTSWVAIRDLFRFCVTEYQDTAYGEEPGQELRIARALVQARRSVSFVVEQFGQMADQGDYWKDLDLSLPVDPFKVTSDAAGDMTLDIAGRGLTLSLWQTPPSEFRHNLEHLVFHDSTIFRWEDSCSGTMRAVTLERQRVFLLPDEDPVLLIYEEDWSGFVGFCLERDVIPALAEAFRKRYPKSGIGGPLRGLLRVLQARS